MQHSKKLTSISGEGVEVGHFQEQGEHYSGYTFVELMYYHHTGSDPRGDQPVQPRPVLNFLRAFLNLSDPKYNRAIRNWFKRPPSSASHGKLLADIGALISEEEKAIFGNSALLTVTDNPTPLVDTGDLRDKVAYKTSVNKVVVEGGS